MSLLEETNNSVGYSSQNSSYINNDSFMHTRINVEPILKRIETFLSGKRKILLRNKEKGNYSEKELEYGEPLANLNGINQIMNKMHTIINNQIVQGNIDKDMYYDFVADCREDFAVELIYSCREWGIKPHQLNYICNNIMIFVETFFTRLIDNKERDSYKESMVSKEIITPLENKRRGLSLGLR